MTPITIISLQDGLLGFIDLNQHLVGQLTIIFIIHIRLSMYIIILVERGSQSYPLISVDSYDLFNDIFELLVASEDPFIVDKDLVDAYDEKILHRFLRLRGYGFGSEFKD